MIIIVCTDERGGMAFNNRRQSRDRILLDDIRALIGGRKLLCAPFSDKMLTDADIPHTASENFLDTAQRGDLCFVEDRGILPYLERTERIIIYNWNRHYPSDIKLDVSPEISGFKKTESLDFQGSSHEKITREIFAK